MENKVDYSKFKHENLTANDKVYAIGDLIASSTSNSFGDKIVHYREYVADSECSYFVTTGVEYYHEGHWPSRKEMIWKAKSLSKKG